MVVAVQTARAEEAEEQIGVRAGRALRMAANPVDRFQTIVRGSRFPLLFPRRSVQSNRQQLLILHGRDENAITDNDR